MSLSSPTINNMSLFLNPRSISPNLYQNNLYLQAFEFKTQCYRPALYQEFEINQPESIGKSVTKRQAEFLAGRVAARSALQQLRINDTNIPIGKNRSPVWPENVIGTITHTNDIALCAVALKENIGFLGMDRENWIDSSTLEIESLVISESEKWLLNQSDLNFAQGLTLTFSAKESLFKALYPSVGSYFDFSAAEIIWLCPILQQFKLRLKESLSAQLVAGSSFKGSFECDSRGLTSLIAC